MEPWGMDLTWMCLIRVLYKLHWLMQTFLQIVFACKLNKDLYFMYNTHEVSDWTVLYLPLVRTKTNIGFTWKVTFTFQEWVEVCVFMLDCLDVLRQVWAMVVYSDFLMVFNVLKMKWDMIMTTIICVYAAGNIETQKKTWLILRCRNVLRVSSIKHGELLGLECRLYYKSMSMMHTRNSPWCCPRMTQNVWFHCLKLEGSLARKIQMDIIWHFYQPWQWHIDKSEWNTIIIGRSWMAFLWRFKRS